MSGSAKVPFAELERVKREGHPPCIAVTLANGRTYGCYSGSYEGGDTFLCPEDDAVRMLTSGAVLPAENANSVAEGLAPAAAPVAEGEDLENTDDGGTTA